MIEEMEHGTPVEELSNSLKVVREIDNEHQAKTVYSGTDLLNMNIKEIPKLWKPYFPVKGVVGLTGSSDGGKSTLLRQLAIAIALRKPDFIGCPLNIKYGRAIYVCTEDDFEGIAANLHKQAGDVKPEEFSNILFVFESLNVLRQLDEILSTTNVDLVVIDVWSDTYIGNPNSWVDVRQNLSKIKALANKYECLIAIIHHTVKNSEKSAPDKNKLNGSQAIEAKLRCLIELRKGDTVEERVLYVLKNNYMSDDEKSEGLVLQFHKDRLLFTKTDRKVFINGGDGGKKYDTLKWVQRMTELKMATGFSFDRAREELVGMFAGENVPGVTWFKNNCKSLDGQANNEQISV